MIQKLTLFTRVLANALPVAGLIIIIPLVTNDYILTLIYSAVIAFALWIKNDKRERIFFAFGTVVLFISEYVFVTTGVETFERTSLLGVMPLWLPLLWGYAFVALRRMIAALDRYYVA